VGNQEIGLNDGWRYARGWMALGLLGLACSENSETTSEASSDTSTGSDAGSTTGSDAGSTTGSDAGSTTGSDAGSTGGSGGGSTGDAAGGTSSGGGQGDPCPENPHAECAFDCSQDGIECGTETSVFDARGCPRDACYVDADCEDGQRCFGVGPDDPTFCIPPTTCLAEDLRCSCSTGASCLPGYCVPL